MPIFFLAVAATLLILLAAVDRVVFRGFAPVRLDADAKPHPKRRAIVVLPPLDRRLGYTVKGTVPPAKADEIAWTPNAKRMVVLRRRLLGRLRVTYVS